MGKIKMFLSGDNLEDHIFYDLFSCEKVVIERCLFRCKGKLLQKARDISVAESLSFFQKLYLFIFTLLFCKISVFSSGKFLFTNPSIQGMSPWVFKKLFQSKEREAYILIIDKYGKPMARHAYRCADSMKKENIYTFDEIDSFKMKIRHTSCIHSKRVVDQVDVNTDLFYIGYAIDKMPLLKMVDSFIGNSVKASIMVLGLNRTGIEYKENNILFLSKYKNYEEVLNLINSSNCLLEVLQKGQSGATSRYYEAVFYNKKLLTTNKNVKKLPFYDERYMRVFASQEDIDIEWITKKEIIDYRYDGRFSPVNLIKDILKEN